MREEVISMIGYSIVLLISIGVTEEAKFSSDILKLKHHPLVKRQFGGGNNGGMGMGQGGMMGGMNGFAGGNGFSGMGGMGGMNPGVIGSIGGMGGGPMAGMGGSMGGMGGGPMGGMGGGPMGGGQMGGGSMGGMGGMGGGMGGGGMVGMGNGPMGGIGGGNLMMGMNQGGGMSGGMDGGMNGGFGGPMMGMGAGQGFGNGGGPGMMMNGQGLGGMMAGGQGMGNFMGAQRMDNSMQMPMQQMVGNNALRFNPMAGIGMGQGAGLMGGMGGAGIMQPGQAGLGLANGMGMMGMNGMNGAGVMGMNPAMGGMINSAPFGVLGGGVQPGAMGMNGFGGGMHPNMAGQQFSLLRRHRWSKFKHDHREDEAEKQPTITGTLAFSTIIEQLKEGLQASDEIDAQETSSCGECVTLDLRKITGSWTQIYGNARSLRMFYTALSTTAKPRHSRTFREAYNDTWIQPSCINFFFSRPFPTRVSDSIIGEAPVALRFRDDGEDAPLMELNGSVEQSLVPNEAEIVFRINGLAMPMCLVKGGPVPGGDYDYIILMETRGHNRCKALHVLTRNSAYFFRNYSSDVIQFLQDRVRSGEAEPVKVMPNPEQCDARSTQNLDQDGNELVP